MRTLRLRFFPLSISSVLVAFLHIQAAHASTCTELLDAVFKSANDREFQSGSAVLDDFRSWSKFLASKGISPPEVIHILGADRINQVVAAAWVNDHPEQGHLTVEEVLRQPGYSIEELARRYHDFEKFEIKRVHWSTTIWPPTRRAEASISALDRVKKGEVPDAETTDLILEEILTLQFGNNPTAFKVSKFIELEFQAPNGALFSASEVLYWSYLHHVRSQGGDLKAVPALVSPQVAALLSEHFKTLHLDKFPKRVRGSTRDKALKTSSALSKAQPPKSSAPPIPKGSEEMQKFIRKHKLEEILSRFSNDPETLEALLSLIRSDLFPEGRSAEFVHEYLGLELVTAFEGGRSSVGDPFRSEQQKRQFYLSALMDAVHRVPDEILTRELDRQVKLIKRLHRFEFQSQPQDVIRNLQRESETALTGTTFPSERARTFVHDIYARAAADFQRDLNFDNRAMRSQAFPFQLEGARFLSEHPRAILADEPGLGKSYQAIAGAEATKAKKVLWITNASNRGQIVEEIRLHAKINPNLVIALEAGQPGLRRRQVDELSDKKYVVVSYDNLIALKKNDPEAYAKLQHGVDLMIIDEAQVIDNPKTLRSSTITDFESPRVWMLSASPWQSKPSSLFNLLNYLQPESFRDKKLFEELYLRDAAGLSRLHRAMDTFMLRRSKEETVAYFDDPEVTSFEAQLAQGGARLPRKRRLTPEESGSYELLPEQTQMIADMIDDFESFVRNFNLHLPKGAEPIRLEDLNPLTKFDLIHRVIYQPARMGIMKTNPLYQNLENVVKARLGRGEKVILWAWHTGVLDELQKTFGAYGVQRIDGEVTGVDRDNARRAFQEDPNVRVLVANYKSGGVGLTLTAAHAAVYVELPTSFTSLYQSESRHQRVISAAQSDKAKAVVDVEWQMPLYHADTVAQLPNRGLRDKLAHGTIVEQTLGRLEMGRKIFDLVMSGVKDPKDLDFYFKDGILSGFTGKGPERLSELVPENRRALAQAAEVLKNLWTRSKGHPDNENKVLQLINNLQFYPDIITRFSGCDAICSEFFLRDIDFLNSLFELKNKYVREQMLRTVPDLAHRLYLKGQSITGQLGDVDKIKISPVVFLSRLLFRGGTSQELRRVSDELSLKPSGPDQKAVEERLATGIMALHGSRAESFLEDRGEQFAKLSLEDRVDAIYRGGLLANLAPQELTEQFPAHTKLTDTLEEKLIQNLANFTQRSVKDWHLLLASSPEWQGGAERLSALLMRWRELGDPRLLAQFREGLQAEIDRRRSEFRYGNLAQYGNRITYHEDRPEFWRVFESNLSVQRKPSANQRTRQSLSLYRAYDNLKRRVFSPRSRTPEEGRFKERFASLSKLDYEPKRLALQELKGDIHALGLHLANPLAGLDAQRLDRLGLKAAPDKQETLALKTELEAVSHWMELNDVFEGLRVGVSPKTFDETLDMLSRRENQHRRAGQDVVADEFQELKMRVRALRDETGKPGSISLSDSDDPALFTKMGCMAPGMTNCFNPNGNPGFNQYVMGAWGSKNTKILVVRNQAGEAIATALYKIKRNEKTGGTVLFLERALARDAYDYREEMLDFLWTKKNELEKSLGEKIQVMAEVSGRGSDSQPVVTGTGAYTDSEYVEPLWGIRKATSVKHRGEIFEGRATEATELPAATLPSKGKRRADKVSGIGTSNKSIDDYLKSLQKEGIKTVVDVRALPQSRFYPHFNRDRLEKSLKDVGIGYVWMGDSLGNPKDSTGQRSMDGFKRYMQTPKYRSGRKRLEELLDSSEDKVALTCAEAAESECHRKFILEDLRREPDLFD